MEVGTVILELFGLQKKHVQVFCIHKNTQCKQLTSKKLSHTGHFDKIIHLRYISDLKTLVTQYVDILHLRQFETIVHCILAVSPSTLVDLVQVNCSLAVKKQRIKENLINHK